MPRIIVVSDVPVGGHVLLSERVEGANLASEHFRLQLADRVRWAVGDAQRFEASRRLEQAPRADRSTPEVAAGRSGGQSADTPIALSGGSR